VAKKLITTAVLILTIAAGILVWRVAFPRTTRAHIQTANPSHGEFVVTLPADGTLESDDSVVVRTGKAPGQLTMIVSDGTNVHAGDVFCKIEARELLRKQTDAQLAAQQAQEEIDRSYESAQENADNAQRSLDQAQKDYKVWQDSTEVRIKQAENQLKYDIAQEDRLRLDYERSQRMADKGYLAKSEAEVAKASFDAQHFKVEQSRKDLEVSRSQIDSERQQKDTQVKAAQQRLSVQNNRIQWQVQRAQERAKVAAKQLADIMKSLADSTITAPASGTVSLFSTYQGGERRSWREGDQVSTGTPLGTISGSKSMSVRCRIKESSISALRKGQQAEIVFEALSGRKVIGTVASVGSVARQIWAFEDPTAEPNVRVFDVLVKVKNTTGLKPGLNARVGIVVTRLQNVIYIPLEAVFEQDGKNFVYVKQGESFVRRNVEVGERNDLAIVIRKGLGADEIVAMSDPTRSQAKTGRKRS
jgi:HlyD family secretion protein